MKVENSMLLSEKSHNIGTNKLEFISMVVGLIYSLWGGLNRSMVTLHMFYVVLPCSRTTKTELTFPMRTRLILHFVFSRAEPPLVFSIRSKSKQYNALIVNKVTN